MSITRELIDYISSKPFSQRDLDATALLALDAVATAYAGSATPTGKILLDWARSCEGDLGRCVLLMGALTHITETDDLHRASVTHPGCVVIPTALALGEQVGASAEKILVSIIHGFEAMCRVGAAVGPMHYKVWHNTATCGPFGSAMAAATLLDLDAEQTMHALGNAGTQSSGFWEFMATGAMSKHLHAGRAGESGLLAAQLAAHGFTGSPEILEGEKGMFAGMCPDPNPDAVMAKPEDDWQVHATSIKPWPSCRHTHPGIDCALELHRQINGAEIKSVELDVYQAALDVCNRPQPESEYAAKFSLYHTAAIALLDGVVGLGSFDQNAREKTCELRGRVQVNVVDPYAGNYPESWGTGVRVSTSNGQEFSASRKDCLGDPELALNDSQMRTKAEGLLDFAGLKDNTRSTICDSILGMAKHKVRPANIYSSFISHLSL